MLDGVVASARHTNAVTFNAWNAAKAAVEAQKSADEAPGSPTAEGPPSDTEGIVGELLHASPMPCRI